MRVEREQRKTDTEDHREKLKNFMEKATTEPKQERLAGARHVP
jgi:hypothetical protein